MVRRLIPGGKWIRTFGPSQGVSQIRTAGAERDIGCRKRFLYGGTDGSNPVPSSEESANHRFLSPHACDRRIKIRSPASAILPLSRSRLHQHPVRLHRATNGCSIRVSGKAMR